MFSRNTQNHTKLDFELKLSNHGFRAESKVEEADSGLHGEKPQRRAQKSPVLASRGQQCVERYSGEP